MKTIVMYFITLCLGGCAMGSSLLTPAEKQSGFTYIPIDPFPVEMVAGFRCAPCVANEKTPEYQDLPSGLPDNAVRMLVEEFDSEGNVTYGPAKAGSTNKTYRVTTDFISADTISFTVEMSKFGIARETGILTRVPFDQELDRQYFKLGSESYRVKQIKYGDKRNEPTEFIKIVNIPVYVGIGLRATADIITTSANASVSGLGVIGAEAETGQLKGSLVVQTLGVNGKAVTAALPIQSELNRTTAQNAIVAVASIKTLLHSKETELSPRVVGLYLPFPGGKPLVNAIVSELATANLVWKRPCVERVAAVQNNAAAPVILPLALPMSQ